MTRKGEEERAKRRKRVRRRMDGNGGGRDVGDCSGVLVLVVVTVRGSTVCGFASGVSCA